MLALRASAHALRAVRCAGTGRPRGKPGARLRGKGVRERRGPAHGKTRSGILDYEHPALGIAGIAITPAYRDATLMRELDGV
jgi:hypothetical protein